MPRWGRDCCCRVDCSQCGGHKRTGHHWENSTRARSTVRLVPSCTPPARCRCKSQRTLQPPLDSFVRCMRSRSCDVRRGAHWVISIGSSHLIAAMRCHCMSFEEMRIARERLLIMVLRSMRETIGAVRRCMLRFAAVIAVWQRCCWIAGHFCVFLIGRWPFLHAGTSAKKERLQCCSCVREAARLLVHQTEETSFDSLRVLFGPYAGSMAGTTDLSESQVLQFYESRSD